MSATTEPFRFADGMTVQERIEADRLAARKAREIADLELGQRECLNCGSDQGLRDGKCWECRLGYDV